MKYTGYRVLALRLPVNRLVFHGVSGCGAIYPGPEGCGLPSDPDGPV